MRIIIVDDHWAVRDGLRWAFSDHDRIEVAGDAAGPEDYRRLLEEDVEIDCVVLDIQMEGASGLELLEWTKQHRPDLKVVMLSMHDDPVFVRRSLELGADGYVLKSAGSEELARALDVVASGGMHVQGEVTRGLIEPNAAARPHLSPRETQVVALVADGLENKQIARRLGISETTVKTHLRNAFERLDATSRSEAVATALRLGLID